MAYRTLKLEKQGPVALLSWTRDEPGNRIDTPFLRELEQACASINDDRSTHVVVLTMPGDTFSTGWWSHEAKGEHLDIAERRQFLEEHPPFLCLEEMTQPVVCAINGDAMSAGFELALACDVRIAADTAHFGFLEREGLPSAGGTQRLPRLVGRGEALRLLLLDEKIDAQEALRIGLVSAVYPRERLLAEAEALALRMASRGPIALRYAKEAVRRGLEQPLEQALRFETDLTVILQTTEDRAEGVRAFLAKREPKFKGK